MIEENDLIRPRDGNIVACSATVPRAFRPHLAEDLIRPLRGHLPQRGRQVHWTVFRALDAPEPQAALAGEGLLLPRLGG